MTPKEDKTPPLPVAPSNGMSSATYTLHVALLRAVKGMVSAWHEWLSRQ